MIEDIFRSRVATKILMHIGRMPYKEFYLSELAKGLKIGLGRTSTLLGDLSKSKILMERRSGNRILYKLNENNPFSLNIIELANLDVLSDLEEKFRTAVNKFSREYADILGDNLTSIVIYGSVAEGKAREWSDIDILVIVNNRLDEKTTEGLRRVSSNVLDTFSKVSQEVIYTQKEFKEMYDIGDDFLINIMSDGIIVMDRDFFTKLLIKGIPTVTKAAIDKRLNLIKNLLDPIAGIYKESPDIAASSLGPVSMHLSRALLLLKGVLPKSKYDIPKQLEGIDETRLSKVYKKTRMWWDSPPADVDKDAIWDMISFLKDRYIECSVLLEGWS